MIQYYTKVHAKNVATTDMETLSSINRGAAANPTVVSTNQVCIETGH